MTADFRRIVAPLRRKRAPCTDVGELAGARSFAGLTKAAHRPRFCGECPEREFPMKAPLFLVSAAAAALLSMSAHADTTPSASSTPAATSSTSSSPSSASSAAHAATPAATHTASASASAAHTADYSGLYRQAQQKLKDLGLYSGAVDGTRNTAYVQSLQRFQTDHHLRVNGRLTTETKHALGI
jgi:Putative peptidoglycan binding domain